MSPDALLQKLKETYDRFFAICNEKEKIEGKYSTLPFAVYGPFEAQVYKVNVNYRMRMIVKCKLTGDVRRMLHELLVEFAPERDVTLAVDMNPLTL